MNIINILGNNEPDSTPAPSETVSSFKRLLFYLDSDASVVRKVSLLLQLWSLRCCFDPLDVSVWILWVVHSRGSN